MRPQERPRKKLKVDAPPLPKEFSDDDDSSVDPEPDPQRPKRLKKIKGWDARDPAVLGPGVVYTDAELEGMLAFCCHKCNCSPSKKGQIPANDQYCKADDTTLWHRRCCHNVFHAPDVGDGDDWLPPYDRALQNAAELVGEHQPKQASKNLVSKLDVWKMYNNSKRLEAAMYNDDGKEHPVDLLHSNEAYCRNEKWFYERAREAISNRRQGRYRTPATVMSFFGGIGSDIVCLKRLAIPIKKIIFVEHDKVCCHVYKYNHDHKYNEELVDDGIEHVYYEKFEEVERNIEKIMKEHGPFDIIVGGPPCVDYTSVNALREGVKGQQGQYMPRFGELITRINRMTIDQGLPTVFFLAENTAIGNDRDLPLKEGDLERIKTAFHVDWNLILDSRDFSPIRRKRTYISNIPLQSGDEDLIDPPPRTCFDDGFDISAHIYEPGMIAKSLGLMASLGRIDDSRMLVHRALKKNKNKVCFEERTLSVVERERLMGFPEGYVSKPVDILFTCLLDEGVDKRLNVKAFNWHHALPKQYHNFSGDYAGFRGKHGDTSFRFYLNAQLEVKMKLAPTLVTSSPSFFTAEQYGKRLIGNAFSIPTVEILLRPLQRLFRPKEYPVYDYNFAWKSHPGEGSEEGPLAASTTRTSSEPTRQDSSKSSSSEDNDFAWKSNRVEESSEEETMAASTTRNSLELPRQVSSTSSSSEENEEPAPNAKRDISLPEAAPCVLYEEFDI